MLSKLGLCIYFSFECAGYHKTSNYLNPVMIPLLTPELTCGEIETAFNKFKKWELWVRSNTGRGSRRKTTFITNKAL